jgi:hypothetical protein
MMTPGRGSQGYLSSGRFNDRISSLYVGRGKEEVGGIDKRDKGERKGEKEGRELQEEEEA